MALLLSQLAGGPTIIEADGASAGVATVSGIGAAVLAGVGAASGLASCNGIGGTVYGGEGVSAGVGAALGAPSSIWVSVGESLGLGRVFGIAPTIEELEAMATPVTNFGKVTVSDGYGSGDTSIVLTTGHGSRLPSTFTYPLTWWNATDYSDPADDPNRELVTVTNRAGDTLTVTRAAEGTSASTKNTGGKTYKMLLGITKAMWEEVNRHALSQSFRGLFLQTHPDSDVAVKKVRLVHAESIVMSDGEEVTDWNDLDFDITAAAGIGGLDTGSEQASTWYRIYAMWNGTTKGLMGQRAKNYKLDTQYITGEDASQGVRSNVDNSTVKVAQGVQFATAGPLDFIDVKLLKTGTPTGNFWFTIEANSGGVPSNTPLATSDKYDVSRLLTTANWVRMPFRTPFSVSAATQYHLVLQGDFAVSASNFMSWRMDGSAGSYANGSKALFDSDTTTWTTDADDDMQFSAYVVENDTALVVPAGYRYAHGGWAYNDSGSNLLPFWQTDHRWRLTRPGLDGQIVNEMSGVLALIDLRTFIPPVDLLSTTLSVSGTGAAAAAANIGGINATDIAGGTNQGLALRLFSNTTAEVSEGSGDALLSYSALMVDGTSGADLFLRGFDW